MISDKKGAKLWPRWQASNGALTVRHFDNYSPFNSCRKEQGSKLMLLMNCSTVPGRPRALHATWKLSAISMFPTSVRR